MAVFIFDIETVPDIDSGRRLYDLEGLSDREVANIMFHKRRQETGGSEFLRHHLHRVVAISIAMRSRDNFKVWSLGDADADEKDIVSRFFDGVEKYQPTLVSWNGSGFDLPVLHYRALLHGIAASRYWEMGETEREYKFNNYISRYHNRHLDLMDLLSAYQPRAVARLDEIATMLGYPGKMGMDGSKVFDTWMDGGIDSIRDYCETDVLNTYLVYLRFEQMRGNFTAAEYDDECRLVRDVLQQEDKPHFQEFLQAWPE